jgi:hypothetical protein
MQLSHIGPSNRDEILKFKQGELDGMFHVHRSYHDPHEVVLDTTDHCQIAHSDEVQNLLKTFIKLNTILFVGCGSRTQFQRLIEWASE